MDLWSPEPREHQDRKRSFTEMSHSHATTLSPSPLTFGESAASSFFSPARFASASSTNNLASFFERRRTSHPHNSSSQRRPEDMSRRSQSQLRPPLEHRTSQTVIDLTASDDDDSPEVLISHDSESQGRLQRPPQLSRSDAVSIGDYVDLTDDQEDPDVILMGGRQLPAPSLQFHSRPMGSNTPNLPQAARRNSPPPPSPFLHPHAPVNRVFPLPRPRPVASRLHQHGTHMSPFEAQLNMQVAIQMGHRLMNHLENRTFGQHMPDIMPYDQPALGPPRPPAHVAPPKAKEGFTRSLEEDQVVICPSCEEELIHRKGEDAEPPIKKNGKAPTKKEREEHPFWVLKDCGHVYCNNCFQHRTQSGKHGAVSFREAPKSASSKSRSNAATLLCSVDDCGTEIKRKEKWVGVFL